MPMPRLAGHVRRDALRNVALPRPMIVKRIEFHEITLRNLLDFKNWYQTAIRYEVD